MALTDWGRDRGALVPLAFRVKIMDDHGIVLLVLLILWLFPQIYWESMNVIDINQENSMSTIHS